MKVLRTQNIELVKNFGYLINHNQLVPLDYISLGRLWFDAIIQEKGDQ